MNRKYNLKLDLQFRCNNSTMKFNQFDNNTSDFFMRITNGGNLVDIEKAIVVLAIIKPSGKVASQFVEVENGLVYADLKPNMRDEIGTYTAKAMLILEDERVVTDSISYEVEEDKIFSLLNDTVGTSEEFTLLTDMLSRLSAIEISEEQRVINEAERILSEENRKIEEAKRVEAELIRQHEEADRAKYDATRESNENTRKQNESIRLANETNRIDEESKRVEEEANRVEAEQLRKDNYNFMTEDEERRRSEANAHREAEVLRVQAENTRVNEEAKRRTTEQARVSAENTRVSNENTRKANETTRQNNETKRVEAETQRQNRYNSFIADAEANANNFENYTNSAKIKEEERKSNELDRKSQEDRRVSNEVERISNENTRKANEAVREKNETSRQNIFENKVDEVDSKISELDSAKSDMATSINNKVNEVENRFNALTSKQQQDAEVIDARDGETSLKARLDRDIEKAKQIYVNVEGSHISTDSSVGYAKDVEILGNTIQSASNLADIRSVGDEVEGQELYEIPVVSYGKNLIDCAKFYGHTTSISTIQILKDANSIKINGNGSYASARIKLNLKKGEYIVSKDCVVTLGGITTGRCFIYINNTHTYTLVNTKQSQKISLTSDSEVMIDLIGAWGESTTFDATFNVQLEEGTVATPYEPYIEDKLTILSPVQLEKVGDIEDRIIEKDGVLGVEKNIVTYYPSLNKIYNYHSMENSFRVSSNSADAIVTPKTSRSICNLLIEGTGSDWTSDKQCCYVLTNNTLVIKGDIRNASNLEEAREWIKSSGLYIKYPTTQPQFIHLPHDQQIKLRTFANKTNISFGCEIEGTIKAQVPKSLGATVNTHTEQINNLNKELDRVKKLEESTVSTVATESDFTTVEQTSNGYFEDVKLEGKTLVNLAKQPTNNGSINHQYATISTVTNIKSSTVYTYIIRNNGSETLKLYLNNNGGFDWFDLDVEANSTVIGKAKTLPTIDGDIWLSLSKAETIEQNLQVVLLEGDHTQNPPSYFEGLKSVGQSATTSEDGVDEIVVSSVKGDGNLFEILEDIQSNSKGLDIKFDKAKQEIKVNGTCTDDIYFYAKSTNIDRFDIKAKNSVCSLSIDICEGTATIGDSNEIMHISIPNNLTGNAINLRVSDKFAKIENVSLGSDFTKSWIRFKKNARFNNCTIRIMLNKGTTPKPYTPHQSDKKRLLYYNEETQAWEKPILREWDSIEKHANGKYYYHQRSGEGVFDGSEDEKWWDTSEYGSERENTLEFRGHANNILRNLEKNNLVCDKFNFVANIWNKDAEGIGCVENNSIDIRIPKSKLSTQDTAGFKQWLQANNVTVVYQLAQEKVYECTNIDLITYANETNYVVESGVLSPRTTLKVHNNISNVVSLLQKKVSLLESNVTSYMTTQNRLMLASRYNSDAVSFKVDYAVCSENMSQENYDTDLYNLILNNILVGKDNYDYNHMFNIIMDYASWSQISWDQFDILVGLMDIQHNPPIEEIPTDDEIVEEIPNEIM